MPFLSSFLEGFGFSFLLQVSGTQPQSGKNLWKKRKKAVKRNTFFWFSTFCSFWQSTAIMRYVKAKNSQIGGKKV